MRRRVPRRVLFTYLLVTLGVMAVTAEPNLDLDQEEWAAVEPRLQTLGEASSAETLAWIEIPRVQVSGPVLEGVDPVTIRRAIGHFPETAWPGEGGNVALAAHRTNLFRGLRNIAPGDTIYLALPTGSFQYCVRDTLIVDPGDVWVLRSNGAEVLTLVTCFPFDYRGHAPHRLIVRADPVAEKEMLLN